MTSLTAQRTSCRGDGTTPALLFAHLPLPTVLFTGCLLTILFPENIFAEVRVVTASGEYRMGDRDTREDAIRLATETAKRNALEQVATYLESVTVVTDLDLTKEEIRTYTAGVVLVQDQGVVTSLDGDTIVIRVDLTAEVDTEEVAQAVAALKQHEEARQELVALMAEVDQLHQELDAANQALMVAGTPEDVQQISQQRQDLLNKAQSNSMVSQAWTDWVLIGPSVNPYPWVGLAQIRTLLAVAGQMNPSNPHVQIAQQVVATQSAAVQPQPPVPEMSHTPPDHPATLSRSTPLTLNEIHLITPPTPSSISPAAQPPAPSPTAQDPRQSRRLTHITQLNPFLLAPPGTAPTTAPPVVQQIIPPQGAQSSPSRSLSRMYRQIPPTGAVPPPAVTSQVPAAPQMSPPVAQSAPSRSLRNLSPRLNHLLQPNPHTAPLVPSHVAPSAPKGMPQGSGGQSSGGRGGGRGGGGRGGGK